MNDEVDNSAMKPKLLLDYPTFRTTQQVRMYPPDPGRTFNPYTGQRQVRFSPIAGGWDNLYLTERHVIDLFLTGKLRLQ